MSKTIMLVCAAGMSTSLLVTKMLNAAKAKNLDIDIFATSSSEAEQAVASRTIDAMLLGPQVRFLESEYTKKFGNQGIPVSVINMSDYGMMNGEKVLQAGLNLIENQGGN
jgi:PTS system cellobiose-specific IIB component